MLNQAWPSAAKVDEWSLLIEGHTRGAASREGAATWSRGQGAHWVGRLSVLPMITADALKFRAFLHSLRGRSGSFLLPIPGVQGVTLGSRTLAADIAADASSLTLSSSHASFVAGAYFTLGALGTDGQLLRVVSVSGTTVTFRPRARVAFTAGAAISVGPVSGLFRLAESTPAIPLRVGRSASFGFAIEEFR